MGMFGWKCWSNLSPLKIKLTLVLIVAIPYCAALIAAITVMAIIHPNGNKNETNVTEILNETTLDLNETSTQMSTESVPNENTNGISDTTLQTDLVSVARQHSARLHIKVPLETLQTPSKYATSISSTSNAHTLNSLTSISTTPNSKIFNVQNMSKKLDRKKREFCICSFTNNTGCTAKTTSAENSKFPFISAITETLFLESVKESRLKCIGTNINEYLVLTSSECFHKGRRKELQYKVKVGCNEWSSDHSAHTISQIIYPNHEVAGNLEKTPVLVVLNEKIPDGSEIFADILNINASYVNKYSLFTYFWKSSYLHSLVDRLHHETLSQTNIFLSKCLHCQGNNLYCAGIPSSACSSRYIYSGFPLFFQKKLIGIQVSSHCHKGRREICFVGISPYSNWIRNMEMVYGTPKGKILNVEILDLNGNFEGLNGGFFKNVQNFSRVNLKPSSIRYFPNKFFELRNSNFNEEKSADNFDMFSLEKPTKGLDYYDYQIRENANTGKPSSYYLELIFTVPKVSKSPSESRSQKNLQLEESISGNLATQANFSQKTLLERPNLVQTAVGPGSPQNISQNPLLEWPNLNQVSTGNASENLKVTQSNVSQKTQEKPDFNSSTLGNVNGNLKVNQSNFFQKPLETLEELKLNQPFNGTKDESFQGTTHFILKQRLDGSNVEQVSTGTFWKISEPHLKVTDEPKTPNVNIGTIKNEDSSWKNLENTFENLPQTSSNSKFYLYSRKVFEDLVSINTPKDIHFKKDYVSKFIREEFPQTIPPSGKLSSSISKKFFPANFSLGPVITVPYEKKKKFSPIFALETPIETTSSTSTSSTTTTSSLKVELTSKTSPKGRIPYYEKYFHGFLPTNNDNPVHLKKDTTIFERPFQKTSRENFRRNPESETAKTVSAFKKLKHTFSSLGKISSPEKILVEKKLTSLGDPKVKVKILEILEKPKVSNNIEENISISTVTSEIIQANLTEIKISTESVEKIPLKDNSTSRNASEAMSKLLKIFKARRE